MSKATDKATVIKLLNAGRASELTAIMQYMAHHYELEDADYGKLAGSMKEIAIEEMKHAEALAERILFLGGEPTTEPDGKVKKGQAIPDMLKTDVGLETGAVAMYNASANACAQAGDQISKQLFEQLLSEEETHLDEFQNVRDHLEQLGNVYLATLTGGEAE
ncbi:MAG TPA: bacterioferritin [Phycisphaerae bacterium]|nr:bacterioferritin [Phycisphaerae bacterium]